MEAFRSRQGRPARRAQRAQNGRGGRRCRSRVVRRAAGTHAVGGSARYDCHMYDALKARYRFRCPAVDATGEVLVPLSRFRRIERLAGPAHPAVFRVSWDCDRCGVEHVGLVTHEELDYAPFEPRGEVTAFWD